MWYNIRELRKRKVVDNMDWNEVTIMFKKFFPDFSVEVMPPCISENRELQYYYMAKSVALGLQKNDKVVIDEENKKVIYFR